MSGVQVTVYGGGGPSGWFAPDEPVRTELAALAGDELQISWEDNLPNREAQSLTVETAVQVSLVFAGTGFAASFFSEAGKDAWAASKRFAAAVWSRLAPRPAAGSWHGYWEVALEDGTMVMVPLSPKAPHADPAPGEIEEALEAERDRVLRYAPLIEMELAREQGLTRPGERVVYYLTLDGGRVSVMRVVG